MAGYFLGGLALRLFSGILGDGTQGRSAEDAEDGRKKSNHWFVTGDPLLEMVSDVPAHKSAWLRSRGGR